MKPENRWKAYMIAHISDDVTLKEACTIWGWQVTFDLVLDKIVIKRYISDTEICLGFSELSSDEPLLSHERSRSYTPKELLALNGYFPAVDLRLGEEEGFPSASLIHCHAFHPYALQNRALSRSWSFSSTISASDCKNK